VRDISVGILQSFVARDYPIYDKFGLVIFDEVHRVSAPTFSQVVPKFLGRYRVGLSATPYRKDRADNVFLYHIGDILFRAKERMMIPEVKVFKTGYRLPDKEYFRNDPADSVVVKILTRNPARNAKIAMLIQRAVKAGRKILVLSERRKHLEILKSLLQGCDVGFYVGGMKEYQLDDSARRQVILATYQMVQEGLDIPEIDTIILATPKGDVEQAIGRCMREVEGKKQPVVVDLYDDGEWFDRKFNMRKKIYDKFNCECKIIV
jgi:superfamily II DNA or RNA helicase